jgi:hypothetical protein
VLVIVVGLVLVEVVVSLMLGWCRRQVDRVGERGQPGLHLEPSDQGDRTEAAR